MTVFSIPPNVWRHVIFPFLSPLVLARLRGSCRWFRFSVMLNDDVGAEWRLFADANDGIVAATRLGHMDLVEWLVEHRPRDILTKWNHALCTAASHGHCHLVEYFERFGATAWLAALHAACLNNQVHLVDVLVKRSETLHPAFYGAAQGGHRSLVDHLFSTVPSRDGAMLYRCEEMGLIGAALGGHLELVDYFVRRGATDWCHPAAAAASKQHVAVLNYLADHRRGGVEVLDVWLSYAARNGDEPLVHELVSRGATNWEGGLLAAATGGSLRLVDFFVTRGATETASAFVNAQNAGHDDILHYLDPMVNYGVVHMIKDIDEEEEEEEKLELGADHVTWF